MVVSNVTLDVMEITHPVTIAGVDLEGGGGVCPPLFFSRDRVPDFV